MQVNNTPKNFAPNFQAIKTYRLPTKEVLECAVGKFSNETLAQPTGLLNIFSKLYNLKKQDLKGLNEIPLGFNLYALSSAAMIKANNPDIAKLSKKITEMPKALQNEEINNLSRKIGSLLDVSIDDSIKTYNMVNGEIKVYK